MQNKLATILELASHRSVRSSVMVAPEKLLESSSYNVM